MNIAFISYDDEAPDLIVSFAIDAGTMVDSLTLLRTPEFEPILDDSERGVSVDSWDIDGAGEHFLTAIRLSPTVIEVVTTHSSYRLNAQSVPDEEMKAAQAILRRMNFDGRFELTIDNA